MRESKAELAALDPEETAMRARAEEGAGIDRRRTLLQALVKEIRYDKGKGITSARMRLYAGVARVLGMANGPQLAYAVEVIA